MWLCNAIGAEPKYIKYPFTAIMLFKSTYTVLLWKNTSWKYCIQIIICWLVYQCVMLLGTISFMWLISKPFIFLWQNMIILPFLYNPLEELSKLKRRKQIISVLTNNSNSAETDLFTAHAFFNNNFNGKVLCNNLHCCWLFQIDNWLILPRRIRQGIQSRAKTYNVFSLSWPRAIACRRAPT